MLPSLILLATTLFIGDQPASAARSRAKRAFPMPRRRPSKTRATRLLKPMKPSQSMEKRLLRQHNTLRGKVRAA